MIYNYEDWSLLEALQEGIFYVYYFYIDGSPKIGRLKGTPRYIGIGVAGRVRNSLSQHNKGKKQKRTLGIYSEHMTRDEAFAAETRLVKRIGIKTDGGPLDNMNYGKEFSENVKKRISKTLTDVPKNDEHRAKISASMKGNSNARRVVTNAKKIND